MNKMLMEMNSIKMTKSGSYPVPHYLVKAFYIYHHITFEGCHNKTKVHST